MRRTHPPGSRRRRHAQTAFYRAPIAGLTARPNRNPDLTRSMDVPVPARRYESRSSAGAGACRVGLGVHGASGPQGGWNGERREAEPIHRPDAGRSRRRAERIDGAHGRSARTVQGLTGKRRADAGRAGEQGECGRTLRAGVAVPSGGVGLRLLRSEERQVHAACRAGHGVRRARQPGLYAGCVRSGHGDDGKPSFGRARLPHRQGGRAGATSRNVCSARSGASSGPAITTTSWHPGCRPWTG